MKVCTKCKVEKELSFFSKDSSKRDKLKCWCKQCSSIPTLKWHNENRNRVRETGKIYSSKKYYSLKDGKFHVYLIPEEHYCGQTDNTIWRKHQHTTDGKITDGFEIFGSYDTRDEAKLVEAQFHALGWFGRAPKDKKFCLNSWQYEN